MKNSGIMSCNTYVWFGLVASPYKHEDYKVQSNPIGLLV